MLYQVTSAIKDFVGRDELTSDTPHIAVLSLPPPNLSIPRLCKSVKLLASCAVRTRRVQHESPLTHESVVKLGENWFPEMRFYEAEKFHPVSLDENFTMIDELFGALPVKERLDARPLRVQ